MCAMPTACPNTADPSAAPEAADNRRVQLLWPGADDLDAAPMARRNILLCKAGQAIARIVAPNAEGAPASDGIPASSIRAGRNVTWDEASSTYIARKKGHVRLAEGVLQVEETLELAEDLDSTNGPVRFDGDIVLRRGVLDMTVVHATRDITVYGCVEAADIRAGRDITVHHGICGKEKGKVQAGGCLSARFLSNAQVNAGGDIIIENESDNSLIQCGAELRVDHGTLMSGHALASLAIHCHTAGSESAVKTILELGLPAGQRAEIQRLSDAVLSCGHKAREIRQIVEPLMARQKTLTAAQKEKATELLYSAGNLETQGQDLSRTLEALKQPLGKAMQGVIRVASVLHPGVIIRFPTLHALVTECLRGPLTVTLSNHAGRPAVVCTDDYRGTKTILSTLDHRPSSAA